MKSDEAPSDLQPQCGRWSPLPDVRMRCEPPEDLPEAEKAIWRDIVSTVQPGWFYGSEALLRAYVSTVAQLETLARARAAEEPCSPRWCQLMRLQVSVIKMIVTLATKLGLTPRSTYDRYQPKVVPSFRRPWESDQA